MNTEMHRIKEILNDKGLTQEWLSKKIGINKIHLNKILNDKASLTKTLAKKISNLPEMDMSEEELMYPKLPLTIVGCYYANDRVQKYEIERPQIQMQNPIMPSWFGLFFKGNPHKEDPFYLSKDHSIVEIFDSKFQKENKIDPRGIYNNVVCCDENDIWRVGWIGELQKKSGKYPFWYNRSNVAYYFKLKWSSICMGSVNLKALQQDLDLSID